MANPKTYHRPPTLSAALELAGHPDTLALAGGAATFGTFDVPYATVIDLQAVPELRQIESQGDGWHIGAACSLQQVVELPGLPDALRQSLTRAVPLNLRNGTTVGESLLQPARFPDWITVLLAHDVAVHHWTQPEDEALYAITEALLEPAACDLRQGIIGSVTIPALEAGEALGTAVVARTPADAPIVSAAVFVRLDAVGRVETVFPAVYGATAAPFAIVSLPLLGQPFEMDTIQHAVQQMTGLNPISDSLGSAGYRAEMVRVLVRRALLDCREQLN